jgi:hypothetical protein
MNTRIVKGKPHSILFEQKPLARPIFSGNITYGSRNVFKFSDNHISPGF